MGEITARSLVMTWQACTFRLRVFSQLALASGRRGAASDGAHDVPDAQKTPSRPRRIVHVEQNAEREPAPAPSRPLGTVRVGIGGSIFPRLISKRRE